MTTRIVLWIVASILVFTLWYALKGRAWLKSKAWTKPFFDWVEPIEVMLWKKSETVLVARLLSWGGTIVTCYDGLMLYLQSSGMDVTPITSYVLSAIPEGTRPLVASGGAIVIGLMITRLRKFTTKPLEIVAIPDAEMPKEVAQAIAEVEVANEVAVAEVAVAQQRGTV